MRYSSTAAVLQQYYSSTTAAGAGFLPTASSSWHPLAHLFDLLCLQCTRCCPASSARAPPEGPELAGECRGGQGSIRQLECLLICFEDPHLQMQAVQAGRRLEQAALRCSPAPLPRLCSTALPCRCSTCLCSSARWVLEGGYQFEYPFWRRIFSHHRWPDWA